MKIFAFILLSITLSFVSCTEEWEGHYGNYSKRANSRIWDTLTTIPKYSEFVKYIKHTDLDTVIKSSNPKTLFIPSNQAFEDYLQGDTAGFNETMKYHITSFLFMVNHIRDKRKLQTLSEKYALIENLNNIYHFDGIEIINSSPLYMDGKYYELSDVVEPKPSLYQYMKYNNPAFQEYIDTKDSIVLNKEESKPVGIDESGKTIYDSVTTVVNLFEEEYFAISEEFRDLSATIIIPNQSTYENALDDMAEEIGGDYNSHEDIPIKWQDEVLIPRLLNKGIYGGLKDPTDFRGEKTANIQGDSILTDFEIDPISRVICSNGLIYDYASFSVGDTLYKEKTLEGETLIDPIGLGRFAWDDEKVNVDGDLGFQPVKQKVPGASNDSILNVDFSFDYQEGYSVSFKLKNVFPAEYRLVWRTNFRTSGKYAIYVNGEKIKLGITGYEEFDTYNLNNGFFSVLGYKLWPDSKGYCNLDGWVNNITEFGDVTIKLEYLGPGSSSENGLNIDYIALKLR